jgi:hypothetical protein
MNKGINIRMSAPRAQRQADREYVVKLLTGYASSIEYGLGAYAAGSDNEKGYLLDKLASLTEAINRYL